MRRNRQVSWKSRVVVVSLAGALMAGACGDTGGDESRTLGLVPITALDVAVARFMQGATQAAEAEGWDVVVIDAEGSADAANAAMQNFVEQEVGAIINIGFPIEAMGAGMEAARDAEIPVATYGGGLGDGVVATVASGGSIAAPVVERLIADTGGNGSLLAFTLRVDVVCRDRELVFDDVIASAPGIDIRKEEVSIPGYVQDGAAFATAWLAGLGPDAGPVAIWGCWEPPVLGAISSLQQQDRSDVLTYGLSGSPEALAAIQDGTLTATMWEDTVNEGILLMETVIEAIEAGDDWEPVELDVPGVLVDGDNIESFLEEHPDALTG